MYVVLLKPIVQNLRRIISILLDLMPDQKNIKNMGATMRLGAYPCLILVRIHLP